MRDRSDDVVEDAGKWLAFSMVAVCALVFMMGMVRAAQDQYDWQMHQYWRDAGCVRHAYTVEQAYACFDEPRGD